MLPRTLGAPYLIFVHGEEVPIVRGSRELAWMTKRVLRGAQRIIANSENTRRRLAESWPEHASKVVVVTPGVDVDRFRPAAPDVAVRRKLGWLGRRVVLAAGRLQQRKGHDHLISALPAIRAAEPGILAAIVGDGEMRAKLEELATSLGVADCVRFHGELGDAELIECYQQCDLAALPNREVNGDFEGFGMVLVEAQACGRPVLAGASGGAPETLRDGETGRIVCCDDPNVIAEAVIDMLSDADALDRMGAAARSWAVERFDWDKIAAMAEAVFTELKSGSSAAASVITESKSAVLPAASPRVM
jgi:phosphatidylinositol alpha-1,6-mannosyltransferase